MIVLLRKQMWDNHKCPTITKPFFSSLQFLSESLYMFSAEEAAVGKVLKNKQEKIFKKNQKMLCHHDFFTMPHHHSNFKFCFKCTVVHQDNIFRLKTVIKFPYTAIFSN